MVTTTKEAKEKDREIKKRKGEKEREEEGEREKEREKWRRWFCFATKNMKRKRKRKKTYTKPLDLARSERASRHSTTLGMLRSLHRSSSVNNLSLGTPYTRVASMKKNTFSFISFGFDGALCK